MTRDTANDVFGRFIELDVPVDVDKTVRIEEIEEYMDEGDKSIVTATLCEGGLIHIHPNGSYFGTVEFSGHSDLLRFTPEKE